nr:MAG TPA: hypothetical protein [Caudoviricetes sp.]
MFCTILITEEYFPYHRKVLSLRSDRSFGVKIAQISDDLKREVLLRSS